MIDFLVRRDDFRDTRIAESETPALEPGQALLRVDTFGLTANNVTYAVFGESMHYWDFFPAADGWGRVPMWGFAEVEDSEAEGVEPGTRLFGYLPPSSHLVVTPVAVEGGGFVDGSPHRGPLPSAYHRYLATGSDPFYRADTEDVQMLLRPLFFTSFLIDDQLADEGLSDARADRDLERVEQDRARRRLPAEPARRSRARRPHLRPQRRVRRGARDLRPASSPTTRSSRSAPVPRPSSTSPATPRCGMAVHSHYGDDLVRSIAVGVTHWEEFGAGAGDLPGPTPSFFFAPDRVDQALLGLGARGAGAQRGRRLAPVLRVDRELARGDPRQWVRGGAERFPRRARGPGRRQARSRALPSVGERLLFRPRSAV